MRRINGGWSVRQVRTHSRGPAAVAAAAACCALTSACLEWPFPAAPVPPTPAPGPRVILPRRAPDSPSVAKVSGHVRNPNGNPVPGVMVGFENASGHTVRRRADDGGYYAAILPAGSYHAVCAADRRERCGVRGGIGAPSVITVPLTGRTIDFIVCRIDQYPACLKP